MVEALPPRFQLETVPSVWSRLLPSSKVGFTQKLLGKMAAPTKGAPSSRKAKPIRHPVEAREAGGSLRADERVPLLGKLSDVSKTLFGLAIGFGAFIFSFRFKSGFMVAPPVVRRWSCERTQRTPTI